MARLEKTLQNYQEQLKDKGIKDIPEFVQSILDADITKGKYSRFLLDCFLNDKFREEDLKGGLNSTIGQAIILFHKHKSKLPEDMRSIYKYDSPGSLWNAVKQFDGELSGKEIKRSEQDKVYAETEFVYEDIETGLKIVSPLTEGAAKWWGKGTRWCTAAEKNNMFYEYAKHSPLLIFLMSNGDKLQLWKNGDDVQFMDEADNEVKRSYIIENDLDIFDFYTLNDSKEEEVFFKRNMTENDYIKYIDDCVKRNKDIMTDIKLDKTQMSLKVYKHLFNIDKYAFILIPSFYRDENMYKEVIEHTLVDIENEKNDLIYREVFYSQNENICNFLINNVPIEKIYKYLPEEKITRENTLEALSNSRNIEYVPHNLLTKEMINLLIDNDENFIISKTFLNKAYKSFEKMFSDNFFLKKIIKKGVSLNYLNLVGVKLTYDICLDVVKNNISEIKDVPPKILGRKFYEEITKYNSYVVNYIPKEEINMKMLKNIVKLDGTSLKYIPSEKINFTLCKEAMLNNCLSYKDIPQHIKEKYHEIFFDIGRNNIDFIEFNTHDNFSEEYCYNALKKDFKNIRYIPSEKQNEKMISLIFEDCLEHRYHSYCNLNIFNKFLIEKNKEKYEEVFKELKEGIIQNNPNFTI